MLERFNMLDCTPVSTPLDPSITLQIYGPYIARGYCLHEEGTLLDGVCGFKGEWHILTKALPAPAHSYLCSKLGLIDTGHPSSSGR
jgi:hypothetical protein